MVLTSFSRLSFVAFLLTHVVITEGLQILRHRITSESQRHNFSTMQDPEEVEESNYERAGLPRPARLDQPDKKATPADIKPADLWGIHDLLLLGHYGVMLKGPHILKSQASSEGLRQSRLAVKEFAKMLPSIHPVAKCRIMLKKVNPSNLVKFANTSWTCLGLDASYLKNPFTKLDNDYDDASLSMNTMPKYQLQTKLGACRYSKWPRACSFWSSIHTMGVRADLLGKGTEYFKTILSIVAGGPLFCEGCTRHLRLLNGAVLPPKLLDEKSFFPGV